MLDRAAINVEEPRRARHIGEALRTRDGDVQPVADIRKSKPRGTSFRWVTPSNKDDGGLAPELVDCSDSRRVGAAPQQAHWAVGRDDDHIVVCERALGAPVWNAGLRRSISRAIAFSLV